MIKTKEKGGFFGKALAAACSVALVASLTPAVAVSAFAAPKVQDAPTRIKVTVQQLDDQGNATKTVVKNLTSSEATTAIAGSATAVAQSGLYYSDRWGVATALSGGAANITDFVKNAVVDWTWPSADELRDQNPTVEIKSGYQDPATAGAYPEGTIPQFVQSVSTDWMTLADSTNFYGNATNTGINGTFATTATTGAMIVDNGKSVFNEITTDQYGQSLKADAVATANASVKPFETGFAFVTGMTANNAANHAQQSAAQQIQGVNEITVTFTSSKLDKVDRIAGTNWDNTMADIVDETVTAAGNYAAAFTKADTFVIATANGYEDALAASGFAGLIGAPLLMTDRNQLTQETIDTIKQYRTSSTAPLTIYLVGGNMVVSDAVQAELEDLAGVSNTSAGYVERIAGANSWDTALALYERGIELGTDNKWGGEEIIVATSIDFQDALSISPYAYANKLPVILTTNEAVLSDEVAEALQANLKSGDPEQFTAATFVGGTVVVSAQVAEQLKGVEITRLAGTTAYDTSAAIAEFLLDEKSFTATTVGIATGLNYLDALSSCNYTGTQQVALILADQTNESAINGFLMDNGPQGDPKGDLTNAIIFGGTAVVSQQVAIDANNALS